MNFEIFNFNVNFVKRDYYYNIHLLSSISLVQQRIDGSSHDFNMHRGRNDPSLKAVRLCYTFNTNRNSNKKQRNNDII